MCSRHAGPHIHNIFFDWIIVHHVIFIILLYYICPVSVWDKNSSSSHHLFSVCHSEAQTAWSTLTLILFLDQVTWWATVCPPLLKVSSSNLSNQLDVHAHVCECVYVCVCGDPVAMVTVWRMVRRQGVGWQLTDLWASVGLSVCSVLWCSSSWISDCGTAGLAVLQPVVSNELI